MDGRDSDLPTAPHSVLDSEQFFMTNILKRGKRRTDRFTTIRDAFETTNLLRLRERSHSMRWIVAAIVAPLAIVAVIGFLLGADHPSKATSAVTTTAATLKPAEKVADPTPPAANAPPATPTEIPPPVAAKPAASAAPVVAPAAPKRRHAPRKPAPIRDLPLPPTTEP